MEAILTDPSQIKGHIYLITNTITNTGYVGQTVSHRKNHGKYRFFGYEGRFRDHISEAVCNTKKKQCSYLNNAIRSHGKDAFMVALLEECDTCQMDDREKYYIQQYNTLYPNGYNLTLGGKGQRYIKVVDADTSERNTPKKRGGCTERSEATRQKMSTQLKKIFSDETVRNDLMKRTQKQHEAAKLERFKGVIINISDLDRYIRKINSKYSGEIVKITVDGISARFVGKHESYDILYQRAKDFLQNVYYATLSNCSGKP
jgi:group I intron endonuclease